MGAVVDDLQAVGLLEQPQCLEVVDHGALDVAGGISIAAAGEAAERAHRSVMTRGFNVLAVRRCKHAEAPRGAA
jgi:hypothetical protein